jgi:hypothetical protein
VGLLVVMTVVAPAGRTVGRRAAMIEVRRVGMTVGLLVGRLGGMIVGLLGVELRGVTTAVRRVGMTGRPDSRVASGPARGAMTV